jgi:hypothetical protein
MGGSAYEIASNTKRVTYVTMPEPLLLAKATAYLDGGGAGVSGSLGAQAVKALVYDGADNLLAESDEVVVQVGEAPTWQDFTFASLRGHLLLPAGLVSLGLHGGGLYSNIARVYGDDPHGPGGKTNSDSYADGASLVFGAASALTADMSIFMTAAKRYADIAPRETDGYLARLPWQQAQAALAVAGPIPRTGQVMSVGWHHTVLDAEVGANALVTAPGPFSYLVGERVKITTQGVPYPRAVYAYVHDAVPEGNLDWDLSVTRRVFSQLAMLATDMLDCVVEVVG